MKILVTGSKGQLGIDLMDSLAGRYDVCGRSRDEMDITDIDCTAERSGS